MTPSTAPICIDATVQSPTLSPAPTLDPLSSISPPSTQSALSQYESTDLSSSSPAEESGSLDSIAASKSISSGAENLSTQPTLAPPQNGASFNASDMCMWESGKQCVAPRSCYACLNMQITNTSCLVNPFGQCIATSSYVKDYQTLKRLATLSLISPNTTSEYFSHSNYRYCEKNDSVCSTCGDRWRHEYNFSTVPTAPLKPSNASSHFCWGENNCLCFVYCELEPEIGNAVGVMLLENACLMSTTSTPAPTDTVTIVSDEDLIVSLIRFSIAAIVFLGVAARVYYNDRLRDRILIERRAQRRVRIGPLLNLEGWTVARQQLIDNENYQFVNIATDADDVVVRDHLRLAPLSLHILVKCVICLFSFPSEVPFMEKRVAQLDAESQQYDESLGAQTALIRVVSRNESGSNSSNGLVEYMITYASLFQWLHGVWGCVRSYTRVDDKPVVVALACRSCSIEESALLLAAAGEINWTYVPIDVDQPLTQQVVFLENAHVQIVITAPTSPLATFLHHHPELLSAELSPKRISDYFSNSSFPDLCVFALKQRQSSLPAPLVDSQDRPFYVLHTSGSTGKPKGVVGTRIGAWNRMQWMWKAYPFHETERVMRVTKLTFVDSVWEVLGAMLQRIPLIHLDTSENGRNESFNVIIDDSERFLRVTERCEVTRLTVVPSVLEVFLLNSSIVRELHQAWFRLRTLLMSGEVLPYNLVSHLISELPHVTILNLYGSTEVSGDVTCMEIKAPLSEHQLYTWKEQGVPIGNLLQPISETSLMIVNGLKCDIISRDTTESCASSIEGELYLSGLCLARGYLSEDNSNDGTDTRSWWIMKNGIKWFRTGDICKIIDNYIYFCGRMDQLVKIRGQRIQLNAVERFVSMAIEEESRNNKISKEIYEVIAIAVKDQSIYELQQQSLVVFLVVSENSVDLEYKRKQHGYLLNELAVFASQAKIVRWIKEQYGQSHVPQRILIAPTNAIQRLSNGKIDKKALKEWYLTCLAQESNKNQRSYQRLDHPEKVPVQAFVQNLVANLLPHENSEDWQRIQLWSFQELGGNSLLSVLFSWEIQQRFNIQLSQQDMANMTLRDIILKLSNEQPHKYFIRSDSSVLRTQYAPSKRQKTILDANINDRQSNKLWTLSRFNQSSEGLYIPCSHFFELFAPGQFSCRPVWTANLGKCIDASPLVVKRRHFDADSTVATWVIIGSHSSELVCADLNDHGRIIWRAMLDGRIEACAALSTLHELVFVGTYGGSLYAIQLADGKTKWTFRAADMIKATALVVDKFQLVICCAYDHKIYGLDVVTGMKEWEFDMHGSIFSTPVYVEATSQLFCATTKGYLMCASLMKHTIKKHWDHHFPAPVFSSLNADTLSQLLIVGCADGVVYAVDMPTGEIRWQVSTEKPIFSSPCIYASESMIIGSHDGILRKINVETGGLVWFKDLQGPIFSSPTIFLLATSNKLVCCTATIKGEIFFCDEATGDVLLQVSSKSGTPSSDSNEKDFGDIFSSPVVIDNYCLIGTRKNYLYAFQSTKLDITE